jgi:hypothetical protein
VVLLGFYQKTGKNKKMADSKSFGLIIKVRGGKDESAEIVHAITYQ